MTLNAIARDLAEAYRTGDLAEGQARLYARDAVSVEASGPIEMRQVVGLAAIRAKAAARRAEMDVHAFHVAGPFVFESAFRHSGRFALLFTVDATWRTDGARAQSEEIGHYYVEGGRIVREEFYSLLAKGCAA